MKATTSEVKKVSFSIYKYQPLCGGKTEAVKTYYADLKSAKIDYYAFLDSNKEHKDFYCCYLSGVCGLSEWRFINLDGTFLWASEGMKQSTSYVRGDNGMHPERQALENSRENLAKEVAYIYDESDKTKGLILIASKIIDQRYPNTCGMAEVIARESLAHTR
jgi:hypothetical protein